MKRLALALLLVSAACTQPKPNQPTPTNPVPDPMDDPMPLPDPPAAPTVAQPVANRDVASPLMVSGTGLAAATVRASIHSDNVELGAAESVVDPDGAFELRLSYSAPAVGAAIELRVRQSNDDGNSEAILIPLTHRPRELSGTVSQVDGPFDGNAVYVRLYDREDAIVDPVDEIRLDVLDGQAANVDFTFQVTDGTYFLRAFRDAGGPGQRPADGLPTLSIDAQSPMSAAIVVDDGASSGHTLALTKLVGEVEQYGRFNVFTANTSFRPRVPSRYDEMTDEYVDGVGLCGGYYLKITVEQFRTQSAAVPLVKTPSGDLVRPLDDGACHETADNTASSYDDDANDGRLSFGIPDPSSSHVGTYVFFYRDATSGHIHEEIDELAEVKKLERNLPLASPNGTASAPLTPTFQWAAGPGAGAYALRVESHHHGFRLDAPFVSTPMFTPSMPLPDDESFRAIVEVFDVDPSQGADFDAVARSVPSYFSTDADDDSSVTISGALSNLTGYEAPVLIYVDSDDGRPFSNVVVPTGATAYSIRIPSTPHVRLSAFLDADGAGEPDGPITRTLSASYNLGADNDNTMDIEFKAPIVLVSPADGSTAVGTQPKFEWADYTATAPSGAWSYAMFASYDNEGDFPAMIWGLPNTTTSYDFSMPPPAAERFDVVYLASCFESGGQYMNGVCVGGAAFSNPTGLDGHARWGWGVVVIECDYADRVNAVDGNNNGIDDYTECLMDVLGEDDGMYAQSAEWIVYTE